MLSRILFFCLLCAICTLSHAQGADWFYLQGDRDTVKLLWAPYEWPAEFQGFNVKRRVPGGTWKTLNSRPILPTYFPEDIDTRTNDPALREELRKFQQRVAESEPPESLPAVLSKFAEYSKYLPSKYQYKRDAVLGAYRQALLFGFAYQDANVPKGGTYEYALYPVLNDGSERELPVAARIWKWGSVPSLKIPFGKPTLAPNTVESTMRISWPVEHAVLERNLVRNVRIYYVNAEGKRTLWTRKGVDEVKYLHAINVDLTGLGESGAVLFSAVPINYFDLEGTPSESISYEWDKYHEAVRNPGPAVTSLPSPRPPPPPPPPPRVQPRQPASSTAPTPVPAPSPAVSQPPPSEAAAPAAAHAPADAVALLGSASLWLDAATGITLDQGRVSAWRDKSGNGFIATMKDPQRRPTVEPMGNGVPALHFDGHQLLHLERPLEIGAGTLFIVGRSGGDFVRNIILGPVGSNDNNQLRWESPEAAMIVGPHHGSRIVEMPVGDTTLLHVLAVHFDGQRVGFWHNGRPSNVFVFPKPPGKAYSFNSIGSFFSNMYLTGDIAAIVHLRNTLTRPEIEAVDRHLREVYRVR